MLASAVFLPVFQHAVAIMNLQHREAARSVLNFIDQVLSLDVQQSGRERDLLLANHGQAVMQALIHGAAALIPFSRISHQAVVLRSLLLAAPQHGPAWLFAVLQAYPTNLVPDSLKTELMDQLVNSKADIGRIKDGLHRLADVYFRNERKIKRSVY